MKGIIRLAGGGGISIDNLNDNLYYANQYIGSDYRQNSIAVTSGKKYLIVMAGQNEQGQVIASPYIKSGATILSETKPNYSANNSHQYIGVIKATSSTLVVYGFGYTVTLFTLD